MENSIVKILMVDDHPSMLEGYKLILSYNDLGLEIITTAAHNCKTAYEIITDPLKKNFFDLAFLDYSLPIYEEMNVNNGKDLALLLKHHSPKTKIAILTSHTETLLLYDIIKNVAPIGLLVKSDFSADELLLAFEMILNSETYHSPTVKLSLKEMLAREKYLDDVNRKILSLLVSGIRTKDMPEILGISLSTIEKRKNQIRMYLNFLKATDNELIKEAKKQGLI